MAMVSTPTLNNPYKALAWIIVDFYYDYVDSLRYNDQPMEGKPFNMRPAHVDLNSYWTSQGVRYYS